MGASATGLDRSMAMMNVGRDRRPEVRFVAGEAIDLPFPDATFDAVLGSFVLTFDRPVDYNSIFTDGPNQNIFLYYRKPGLSGNDAGTLITLDPTVVPYDA